MTDELDIPRVLVADDDADISTLVAIAVRRSGLTLIDKRSDGESAWHAIRELRPDVVVLDVSMPGMTGLEVCRALRADPDLVGTRVLLLSAAVDDASRQAGLDAGADEYMLKPFSPRELIDRLSRLAGPAEPAQSGVAR
ncbi:response regulator transcription factor [Planctomonas psychrotolerans]|uniref:response regulator transcription factor n=1 Tax=Planctomonas psychrotolerans TaxID=2528712 RepID=UPI001D0D468F|nr:response regulator [Planctomonas psychrotolerans]